MSKYTDDLRAVSEERIPLPEGFEISTEVRAAAMMWPLESQRRIDLVCHQDMGHGRRCGQVVVPVAMDGEAYEYTDEEREGLVLAHLMQRHGWTREAVGAR